jgi:hypothetical protein
MKVKTQIVLLLLMIGLFITNINCYTAYRCPLPVSKQGKLKQKLPKPPSQYNSKLRRYE